MDKQHLTTGTVCFYFSMIMLLACIYVASYPLVINVYERFRPIKHGGVLIDVVDSDELPVYEPVDWLIDYTPFRTIILGWSDLVGCRTHIEDGIIQREIHREYVKPLSF